MTNKDKITTVKLQLLKKVIIEGWPENNKTLPDCIRKYIKYKSTLTVIDDLIFNEQAIGVPKTLQKEMLMRIHYKNLCFG